MPGCGGRSQGRDPFHTKLSAPWYLTTSAEKNIRVRAPGSEQPTSSPPGSATHPVQGLALAQSLTLSDSDGPDSFSSSLEIKKHVQTSNTTCLQLPECSRSRIQTQLSVCEASTLLTVPPHLPSPLARPKPLSSPGHPISLFNLVPGALSCRGPKEHHGLSVGLGAKPSNHIPPAGR